MSNVKVKASSGAAAKQLAEGIEKIGMKDEVIAFEIAADEKYAPITKLLVNMADMERIYGYKAVQRNPELFQEAGEVFGLVKDLNKVFAKRRAEFRKGRKGRGK